ncbi:MAG TPA: sensor histidine kinase [Thermoanaerobaculia bacterium]|nr:sensor histidine kinase [Thermoanaerobaculia bacterium]
MQPDYRSSSHESTGLSATSLRWTVGLLSGFIGAFVLVAPHRYASPSFRELAPFLAWWGLAALGIGVALLSVAILRPGRVVSLIVHSAAGLTLLVLAASFARTGAFTGAVSYGILGLGLIVAGGLRPAVPAAPSDQERDLFALLMGAVAVIDGVALLTLPRLFQGPAFDSTRPFVPVFAIALLVSGPFLCRVHLRAAPRWLVLTAHLTVGSAFLLVGALIALPRRSWTGIAFYLGCGTALAFLPWLSPRLARLDTQALVTRLALALAIATSVSLVFTVAVATTQEERLAIEQVGETRTIEAQSIARAVADFIELNAAQTATIAATAGRIPPEPQAQRLFLARTLPLYPRMQALLLLDSGGQAVAGELSLSERNRREIAAAARRNPRVSVQLLTLPGDAQPHLLLSAPVVGAGGTVTGALVSLLGATALQERITRAGSDVYLADGHGQEIAHRDSTQPVASSGFPGADDALPLPAGWDKQIAAGHQPQDFDGLGAFKKMGGLGWVVAVQRPRSAALAGVRKGRDLAFLLLLAVVPLAVLGGILTARRIARPLGTLADAVDAMTAGNPGAPLSRSSVSEVARLSAAFAEMRDRLAARTHESERLASELRARAEALADSDRRKDEFLAMLAHELRNPLGAIANATYILAQTDLATPVTGRAVGVIQRQIQHLVRLVDDLLDVSRITRGKVELRWEPVDLGDAVRHALETTRPLLEAKSHTLHVHLTGEPLPLHADTTRLEQVVGNLVRNAAKYTDPGGQIEVTVLPQDGEAVLQVKDNGIGIAPDLLPRIFDLFTQGEQALDRAGAGLGIGLTLVRSLVELHGGHVVATSAGPGAGTTMEVRLPLARRQGEGSEGPLSSPIR